MTSLSWRGESSDTLSFRFLRESKRTNQRGLRHMRRVSKSVYETALKWSPVDYKGQTVNSPPLHELEKSHKIVENIGDNRRIEVSIEVGGYIGDVNVDDYALWIHDGSYTPGPGTRAKGPEAGPFWLERALAKHENDIDEPLLDELLESLFR